MKQKTQSLLNIYRVRHRDLPDFTTPLLVLQRTGESCNMIFLPCRFHLTPWIGWVSIGHLLTNGISKGVNPWSQRRELFVRTSPLVGAVILDWKIIIAMGWKYQGHRFGIQWKSPGTPCSFRTPESMQAVTQSFWQTLTLSFCKQSSLRGCLTEP